VNLFAYGTLMCEDILANVIAGRLRGVPAKLNDYRRWAVRDEDYPAIRSQEDSEVQGRFYRDLPEQTWPRLDLFEGEIYHRTGIRALLDDGSVADAETYVIREEYIHLLSGDAWDYEEFLRCGKERFTREYRGG